MCSSDFAKDWVLRTAQDIARGFEYLHENNLVHGDLKPHNILLSTSVWDERKWMAKIADFGGCAVLKLLCSGHMLKLKNVPHWSLGSNGKVNVKITGHSFTGELELHLTGKR